MCAQSVEAVSRAGSSRATASSANRPVSSRARFCSASGSTGVTLGSRARGNTGRGTASVVGWDMWLLPRRRGGVASAAPVWGAALRRGGLAGTRGGVCWPVCWLAWGWGRRAGRAGPGAGRVRAGVGLLWWCHAGSWAPTPNPGGSQGEPPGSGDQDVRGSGRQADRGVQELGVDEVRRLEALLDRLPGLLVDRVQDLDEFLQPGVVEVAKRRRRAVADNAELGHRLHRVVRDALAVDPAVVVLLDQLEDQAVRGRRVGHEVDDSLLHDRDQLRQARLESVDLVRPDADRLLVEVETGVRDQLVLHRLAPGTHL